MSVIGITIGPTERPEIVANYVNAVQRAGGTPVLIPTSLSDVYHIENALGGVDSLVLSGGGDIHPSLYGEKTRTTLDSIDRLRDSMEMIAVEIMTRSERRILGICRGAQMLAVATGGTLVQDLPSEGFMNHFDENHDRGYATRQHPVKAEPGTQAERILSGLELVNSHHHQAIRDPGTTLSPTAWAEDGVIEAVEAPGLLGLQWHPEASVDLDERHLEPFRWLTR
ncbi:gamma-glutamyl-gamma-aminobutyrate hydrolase family protein [Nocardia sp. NBC_01329]|uniref:gamma-glutamyl-gamma-aminobutyrate hydrolase family protein n=1 Tax=Nocardia sp. NBC_01329 TaxID=2903594 RepID=UPI002E0FD2C1|nr:gamma-glutamyl-gamma-aminobutyrate hydrolase family protein [Nocardia sp. NBC_01329]WSJ00729.1 gamma-glutamyl-gamma-aminobutyrate hydrolase family protein [Nocardia sp. NBC_01329]